MRQTELGSIVRQDWFEMNRKAGTLLEEENCCSGKSAHTGANQSKELIK